MNSSSDAQLWSRLWPDAAPTGLTEELAAVARRRTLQDGEMLYARGDRPEGLIGVHSGLMRNVYFAPDGRELLVGLFGAGAWFGEVSLFDDHPRPLHAFAQGATELRIVPAETFHAVLGKHPDGYRHFARVLCYKLRVSLDQLEDTLHPLQQRLAKRLLDLASVYGVPAKNGLRIRLSLPQQDLARMLGSTRQSINKELRALSAQGLLTSVRGYLSLPDVAGLEAVAGKRSPFLR